MHAFCRKIAEKNHPAIPCGCVAKSDETSGKIHAKNFTGSIIWNTCRFVKSKEQMEASVTHIFTICGFFIADFCVGQITIRWLKILTFSEKDHMWQYEYLVIEPFAGNVDIVLYMCYSK